MKFRLIVPVVAVFALAGCTATAQQPAGTETHHPPSAADTDQRFERMDKMMTEAQATHGAERHNMMQAHMGMMHKQMQAMMHGPMGQMPRAGAMGKGDAGQMPQMQQMQQMRGRMDMMQRMMQQMMKQHDMMLQPEK